MPRGSRTKTKKQELLLEICNHLDIPFQEEWKSKGSTITGQSLQKVLEKVAEKTGIPPNHLEEYEKIIWRLLNKSINAMISALDTINRTTIQYRIESFLFLFINAWELLLKAKLIDDNRDVNAISEKNNNKRTITFQNSVKSVFCSELDPMRKNLLLIEDLRNNAAHLFLPVIPNFILLIFQAGIFNFEKMLNEWFKYSLKDYISSGMFLILNADETFYSTNTNILQRQLPLETIKFLGEWNEKVIQEVKSIPENKISNLLIPIDINVSIVNNPKKADILSNLQSENSSNSLAVRIKRPIDQYPLTYTELVSKIKEEKPNIKQSRINEIIKEFGLKKNNSFSFYNFANKKKEQEYIKTDKLSSSTPSIYNYKALRFILEKLD